MVTANGFIPGEIVEVAYSYFVGGVEVSEFDPLLLTPDANVLSRTRSASLRERRQMLAAPTSRSSARAVSKRSRSLWPPLQS